MESELLGELVVEGEDCQSLDSLDVFPHQVGGHHVIVKHPTRPDCIVKPYFPKEIQFYESVQDDPLLRDVISKYHGRLRLLNNSDCIVLEDLTFGMSQPCIMDMKIGRRLYDDDALPDKAARMMRKSASSTSGAVGFRISGMRIIDPRDGHVVVRLKNDVRGLGTADLVPTMQSFFALIDPRDTKSLIARYLSRLAEIETAVVRSSGHFYSSSILFVYDHDDCRKWDCRMIDFVHSHIVPSGEASVDENYLEGLRSLMDFFRRLPP